MPRGGRRAGAPGKSYSNRSDLNVVRQPSPASAGAPVPAPQQPAPAQPAQPTTVGAPAAGAPPQLPQMPLRAPGSLGPTQVNDPLTHGLPTGPGGGPEVLGVGASINPLDNLRAIYLQYPTEALRQLIAFNSSGDV